jgi:hypothetical protein
MIYVIAEVGDASIVKLGFTESGSGANQKAALSRMSSMQVGNRRELVLIATCIGTMKEEQALHRRFRAQWVRGEWFRNEGPVADWVQSIATGSIERAAAQRPPVAPACDGCDVLRKVVRDLHNRYKDASQEVCQVQRKLDLEAAAHEVTRSQTTAADDALMRELTKTQRALHIAVGALETTRSSARDAKQAATKVVREVKKEARAIAVDLAKKPSNCVSPRICECRKCRAIRLAFDPFKRASSGLLIG